MRDQERRRNESEKCVFWTRHQTLFIDGGEVS